MRTQAAARAPASDLRAWRLILAVGLMQALAFADRFLLALLAAPAARALRMDDLRLGVLQGAAFVIPFAAATAVFGRLADRLPSRGLLFTGLALWTAGTAACGLVRSADQMFAARVLLALGEAAVGPVALLLIARHAPSDRPTAGVAVFTAAGPLGKGLALVGGGALLALVGASARGGLDPWRAVFLIAAGLNLAAAPLLWTGLDAGPARPAAPPRSMRPATTRTPLLRLALLCAAGCAAVLASQTLAAWTPVHLHRSFGLPVGRAGVLAGAPLMLASPLGGAGAAVLLDRLGRAGRREAHAAVLAAGLALAAAAAAAFLARTSLTFTLAAYVALAGAVGACTAAFLAGMQVHQPPGRGGEFASWVVIIPNVVGFGAGPALAGWISQQGGGSAGALRGGLLEVIGGACLLGAAAAAGAGLLAARSGRG